MTIAVIGATGNTGRTVVKQLRALGQNPICVVRIAEKAREVLGADAKTAVAELTDRPALKKALAGIQSLFVVTEHNPSMVEQQNNRARRGTQGRRPISRTGRRQPSAGQGGFGIGGGPRPRHHRGAAQDKRDLNG